MQLQEWAEALHESFGAIPRNYLVLDTETLLFGQHNLPVEVGHTLVDNCMPIRQRAYYIDWLKDVALTEDGHPAVEEDWLRDQLLEVRHRMEVDECGDRTGRVYGITFDKLRAEGHPWHKVLRYYLDLVRRTTSRGYCIVGHNVEFDIKLLNTVWSEFLDGEMFDFSRVCLFDTGGLYKAMQLEALPVPNESLQTFMRRMKHKSSPGLKWNLLHCMKATDLISKHGLEEDKLHGAGYDTYCTHLFFEELRRQMEGKPA